MDIWASDGYLDGHDPSPPRTEAKNNLPVAGSHAGGRRGRDHAAGQGIGRLTPEKPAVIGAPLDLEWIDANRVIPAAGPIKGSVVEDMARIPLAGPSI